MKQTELLIEAGNLLEKARSAVLATCGDNGSACVRWMTPVFLKGRPDALFAVTSPDFCKAIQIKTNPKVEWMIQPPSLDEIIYLRGKANIIDNPSLKAEVMESLGSRLTVLWKINEKDYDNFVVLETIIEEGELFLPMKGFREKVSFS